MRALMFFMPLMLVSSGYAALEFSGYIQSSEGTLFVLTDLDTGAASRFLKIGAEFEGCHLMSFDAKNDILTLNRAGTTLRLPLKDSHIRDAKIEPGQKMEVHVLLSPEGNFTIDGQPTTVEALSDRLRQLGSIGGRVELSVHYELPADSRGLEAVRKLTGAFAEVGKGKKWAIRLVSHTEKAQKEPNQSPQPPQASGPRG
jgi:hypothetical protein